MHVIKWRPVLSWTAAFVLVGMCAFAIRTYADPYADPGGVPRLVPFRGHLESSGMAVNSAVTLEVRLFDAQTGGTLLWGPETHTITPTDGDFSLMLGSTVPLSASQLAGGDAWVAIAIGGSPLAGRQRLASVPYALRAADGVPAGTVNAFAGSSAPEGWILADGRALDGDDPRYASLFAAIGTAHGDGTTGADAVPGTTDFNVPDLRGRTVIGAGTYVDPTLDVTTRALGEQLGAAAHRITIAEMPAHSHSYNDYHYYDQLLGHPDYQTQEGDGAGGRIDVVRTTNPTGGGAPHDTMQPSLVLQYVVKL